jgi:hypothetical protein
MGAARLEDLAVSVMEKTKTTKKGKRHTDTGWPQREKAAIREYPFGKCEKKKNE